MSAPQTKLFVGKIDTFISVTLLSKFYPKHLIIKIIKNSAPYRYISFADIVCAKPHLCVKITEIVSVTEANLCDGVSENVGLWGGRKM